MKQMLNPGVNTTADFHIYSNGSQINIHSTNNQEEYEYSVISTNRNEIIKGEITGNSSISNELDSGIYFVIIKGVTSATTKVYIN